MSSGTSRPWWIVRLWVVVAAFASVAAYRSHQVGIAFRDPHGAYLVHRVLISAGLFVLLVAVDGVRRTTARRTPATVRRTIQERWPVRRVVVAWLGLLAYHATYFCYHNLKSWNAFRTVHDAGLERVDRAIFLGHSPAVLLHDLLGTHVADTVLVAVYESFPALVTVSFVAAVVLADRLRRGFVLLAAMVWCWILGTATYYLIPSLGPFHQAPQDFAGLPRTTVQTTQAAYLAQRAHLLAHPQAHDAFAQVAAFASLHVGISSVIWLVVRHYGFRRWARVLGLFVATTAVATVYVGWHFAVDDVAGLTIAALAVALGRLTIDGIPGVPQRRWRFTISSWRASSSGAATGRTPASGRARSPSRTIAR